LIHFLPRERTATTPTPSKNNQYDLKVTEPSGDVSVDCIELKSRGK
jgi:hypothetical protein